MSENTEEVPMGNLQPQKIEIQISIHLTKQYGNYQEALKQAENATVTEETIEQSQNFLRNLGKFIKAIDDHREAMKKPYFQAGKDIDAAHKSVSKKFEAARDVLQKKLNDAAQAKILRLQEENRKIQREGAIKQAINDFILDYSVKIASATNNEQLLAYERLINLEKANKSKYAEFLPLLIERCNDLNGKLAEQKVLIKQKDEIERQKQAALDKNNDEKAMKLAQQEQDLLDKINENTIKVQEQASESIFVSSAPAPLSEMPKAAYTTWKCEIVNEKEVMKKAPELLDVKLNAEKAKTVLNTLKETGALEGKTEYTLNGIRYFLSQKF
jgi:hypothetical protein